MEGIVIDSKTKFFKAVLSEAISSAELDISVSYIDTIIPQQRTLTTDGTNEVTIVSGISITQSPPVNTNRRIIELTIFNADNIQHEIDVFILDGAAHRTKKKITLGVNFTLHFDSNGWYVEDETGSITMITISLTGLEIGETVIDAVVNEYLYVDSGGTLQQGWLYQDSNGLLISDGKFFSSMDGVVQQDFGSGTAYRVSIDSGAFANSYLQMVNGNLTLQGGTGSSLILDESFFSGKSATLISDSIAVTAAGDVVITGSNGVIQIISTLITVPPINQITITSTQAYLRHGTMLEFASPIYKYSNLTADTVVYLDSSKHLVSSSVTPTQLSYLDATSSIQTQLNSKEPTIASGTTAQYWRGDKTWRTLDTTNVPENANLYFTEARVLATTLAGLSVTGSSISSSDSILQAFGKVQNQINGLLGGAIYKGVYNATTNMPTLVDGTGTAGYYYVVNVAGNQNFGSGVINFNIGDWAIYNGAIWQKVDNTDAVSDVNGAIGSVSLVGTTNRITVTGTTWDISASYVGQASIKTLGTVTTATWNASKISEIYGGTNQNSYTTGDILYSSASNTLSKLSIGSSAQIMLINSGIPSWQTVSGDVTIGATGIISISNGAITNAMLAGSIAYSKLSLSGAVLYSDLAAMTSAQLAGIISDETGSGALVFATSPTLVTPLLGTPTSGLLSNCTTATQSAYDNSTKLASTAYVDAAMFGLQIVTSYNLNPTGGSQSNKMMGLAVSITPAKSTRVLATIQGSVTNSVASNVTLNMRYGTGTAPTNGAAATGTTVGTARIYTGSSASGKVTFFLQYPITGLSISTAYWFDVEYTAGTAGAAISTVDVILRET